MRVLSTFMFVSIRIFSAVSLLAIAMLNQLGLAQLFVPKSPSL